MRGEAREARRNNGSSNRRFCRLFPARLRHGEQALVAFCHYSCSCPIKLKKPLRRFGCRFGNFLQRDFSRRGDRFCHDACVRWFRAFSAKRNGRQIWAIGLHHKFPKRNCAATSRTATPFLKVTTPVNEMRWSRSRTSFASSSEPP